MESSHTSYFLEDVIPREYGDLLFDEIGAALVFHFKKLKRAEFNGLKPSIDWSIVRRNLIWTF